MQIKADVHLSNLDAVFAARETVRQKSDELDQALSDLYTALRAMGVEIDLPTDGTVD